MEKLPQFMINIGRQFHLKKQDVSFDILGELVVFAKTNKPMTNTNGNRKNIKFFFLLVMTRSC